MSQVEVNYGIAPFFHFFLSFTVSGSFWDKNIYKKCIYSSLIGVKMYQEICLNRSHVGTDVRSKFHQVSVINYNKFR